MWDPETLGQKLMYPPDQPVRSCVANYYEQQERNRETLINMDHTVALVIADSYPPTMPFSLFTAQIGHTLIERFHCLKLYTSTSRDE